MIFAYAYVKIKEKEGAVLNNYEVYDDIEIICTLLSLSATEFASNIGVAPDTITRWKNKRHKISEENLNAIYNYAFNAGIKLNKIKEQLYREECAGKDNIILFHGAKNVIDGNILIEKSRGTNDFGKGFYCGESMEQSAMFVAGYPRSTLYIFEFDKANLSSTQFYVDQEWMLAIAYFRKRLKGYEDHPIIRNILNKVKNKDFIIAPIADNRMFEIIDSFIEGDITDIQCQHCLSATNLGNQYVIKTQKAIDGLIMKRHCWLSDKEKQFYLSSKYEESKIGNDKVKIAKKQYRGKGSYIEEILR